MNTPGEFLNEYGDYLMIPGLSQHKSEELATGLLERYQESWRRHHTINHLAEMGQFLVENIRKLKRPDELFISVIGHDSYYAPALENPAIARGFNEAHSAILTSQRYGRYIGSNAMLQVEFDIRSTVKHRPNGDRDQMYFLDADMSILGSSPARFDQYDDDIRGELVTDNPSVFNAGRLDFLKNMLGRGSLFLTPEAKEQFDDQATKNLERTIARYEELVTT